MHTAKKSEMGPAYTMPSIPKNLGRRRMSGTRKRICLVSETQAPILALPMAVKKLPVSGWKKLIKDMKR